MKKILLLILEIMYRTVWIFGGFVLADYFRGKEIDVLYDLCVSALIATVITFDIIFLRKKEEKKKSEDAEKTA